MKFPKTTKFVNGQFAKAYHPTGTRIYRVTNVVNQDLITVSRIGLYRLDGFTLSKTGKPFIVQNSMTATKYIPCKMEK